MFSLIQFIYMAPNHNHSLLNVLYIVGGWLKIAALSIHLICVTYLGSDHGGSSLSRDIRTYYPPRPSLPGGEPGHSRACRDIKPLQCALGLPWGLLPVQNAGNT